MHKADVIIIGSEGAGARAALEVKRLGLEPMIVTKGMLGRCGATVTAGADINVDSKSIKDVLGLNGDVRDSKEKFFEDTVIGGRYLSNQKIVEEHVERIPQIVKEMVEWGLVVRRHGSGTYVARKDVHHETSNLTGLAEVLKRQGKEVTSQVLVFEVMPAPPAIASQLRIQINERIYFSRRVRYVEGKPLMLEDSYMPVKLFRNLSLAHLEGSKFDYIEKECGITISGNYESLSPVLADKQLSTQMNVPEQTPLLRITSLSYSDSGEFLNYSVMFRNASEYQVDYHLRRIHPEELLTHPPENHCQ